MITAWVLSFLFSAPILHFYDTSEIEGYGTQCWIDFDEQGRTIYKVTHVFGKWSSEMALELHCCSTICNVGMTQMVKCMYRAFGLNLYSSTF